VRPVALTPVVLNDVQRQVGLLVVLNQVEGTNDQTKLDNAVACSQPDNITVCSKPGGTAGCSDKIVLLSFNMSL
jgi:hypothetical protein